MSFVIKVVRASKSTYWYAKHIDEIFEVEKQKTNIGIRYALVQPAGFEDSSLAACRTFLFDPRDVKKMKPRQNTDNRHFFNQIMEWENKYVKKSRKQVNREES